MQTAEPTKYNDLHKPTNLFQISRNAAILSSKRCSVLDSLSSNLKTDKRNRKRFLPWLQGKLIFLSHTFYTVTLGVRVKIQTLLHKSKSQRQHEVHPMMFAASISESCSEVEEIIMNFFDWRLCKYNVQNIIRNKMWKTSSGVFAFLASSTHPGRRTIIFSLRAPATLGGVLLQVKPLEEHLSPRLCSLLFLSAQHLCFPALHGHQCQ